MGHHYLGQALAIVRLNLLQQAGHRLLVAAGIHLKHMPYLRRLGIGNGIETGIAVTAFEDKRLNLRLQRAANIKATGGHLPRRKSEPLLTVVITGYHEHRNVMLIEQDIEELIQQGNRAGRRDRAVVYVTGDHQGIN